MATPPPRLSETDLAAALDELDEDWIVDDSHLRRHLVFANFAQAFGFMTEIAIVCERAEHHPEWSNVYNRVTVGLTTHDSGGITRNDIDLAIAIDRAARRPGPA